MWMKFFILAEDKEVDSPGTTLEGNYVLNFTSELNRNN